MLLTLSWRNIWRNKIRSLVIIMAIAIGIWAGLFLIAFSWGMSEQRIRDAIETETCHIQIHHPAYREEENLKHPIPQAEKLLKQLDTMEAVTQITSRVKTTGMVASGYNACGVQINGIDPERESAMIRLDDKITEGRYFKGAKRNPILISGKLADKLKVHVRNKIVLTFSVQGGESITAGFKVTGLYKTKNTAYDQMNVFVKASDLQRLTGEKEIINEIAVKLKDPAQSEQTAGSWQKIFSAVLVEYWGDLSPELELVTKSFDQAMQIFILIILLALAFGIINTMLMAVLERTREIGMLMAVGMNKFNVFAMIVLETIMLAVTAVPFGIFFTWITVQWTGTHGIDLSVLSEGFSAFGYSSTVYPLLKTDFYFNMSAEVVLLAIAASIYPAWKAIRLNPVEAIRDI